MTQNSPATLGQTIRTKRLAMGMGLREMARQLGISPTYASQIEKDRCPVPDQRILDVARILDTCEDELFALAGRVAPDIAAIVAARPCAVASFIRTLPLVSTDALKVATATAHRISNLHPHLGGKVLPFRASRKNVSTRTLQGTTVH